MIDARLSGGIGIPTSLIFTAPRRINRGQKFSMDEMVRILEGSGYLASSSGHARGLVEVRPPSLQIRPGRDSYFRSANALRVDFSAGRISRIVDLDSGGDLAEARIEPELLSSLFGDEREKRRLVRYADLPANLVNAVLAAEDKRFFEHVGVDPVRILGAARFDILHGSKAQGGSTLTMQLARSFFFSSKREWGRKLAEAITALVLETKFTKTQIFELYANEIYMGNRGGFAIHGFGEAAHSYFGKDVRDLTLGEACFLAGIIRSPNRFSSPELDPQRVSAARDRVLRILVEEGKVLPGVAEAARNTPLRFAGAGLSSGPAPCFVDMVRAQVSDRIPDASQRSGGYRIYTSLDSGLQADARAAVDSGLRQIEAKLGRRSRPGPGRAEQELEAALVALDVRSGGVLALVGGRDYQQSQINRSMAERQPGSVFKPFVYACAFSSALDETPEPLTPASVVTDEPATFLTDGRPYSPANYRQEYAGPVTLREALVHSLNVATVRVAERVGYDKVADFMRRIAPGMRIEPTPSLALGAYEMTPLLIASAYTIFPRSGVEIEPWYVERVDSREGAVEERHQAREKPVLDPRVAFLVTSILQDVVDRGTGATVRSLGFTGPAAGKTGTSHDGWFAGFTPELLCVVWVGFDDNRELGLPGASSAALIWAEFMKRAVTRPGYYNVREFSVPEGIDVASIDGETGRLDNGCPDPVEEYFIAGTAPTEHCTVHAVLSWKDLFAFRWLPRRAQSNPPAPAPLTTGPRPAIPADLIRPDAAAQPAAAPAAAPLPREAGGGTGRKSVFRRLLGLFKKGSGGK
jgi:penicillin-binding protein 1B